MKSQKEIELEKLELKILPCSSPFSEELQEDYEEAYRLWHSVWSKTLKELDGVEKVFSDQFTRNDFCSVIFRGKEALSLLCYKTVNMQLSSSRNDSWFSAWPKEILENEKSIRKSDALFGSWFCTNPKYRKSTNNYPINTSQIIIETFGKIVYEENYSVGYGVTRNNRGVGKYGQIAGGTIAGVTNSHGCEVNLVLLEPEKLKDIQLSYSLELKTLWNNKIDNRGNYERKIFKSA